MSRRENCMRRALRCGARRGTVKGVSANLNSLGNIAKEVGHYEAARELHEESLVIKRELGDRQGLADFA